MCCIPIPCCLGYRRIASQDAIADTPLAHSTKQNQSYHESTRGYYSSTYQVLCSRIMRTGSSADCNCVARLRLSDTSPLAVHLGNDTAMRRLLRDGVGIKDIQKKYLSLCYVSPWRGSLYVCVACSLQRNSQWSGRIDLW